MGFLIVLPGLIKEYNIWRIVEVHQKLGCKAIGSLGATTSCFQGMTIRFDFLREQFIRFGPYTVKNIASTSHVLCPMLNRLLIDTRQS